MQRSYGLPPSPRCGDIKQAGIAARYCPRCETDIWQQYQVRPDLRPRWHRRVCHRCGWDSGWVPFEEPIVIEGGHPPGRPLPVPDPRGGWTLQRAAFRKLIQERRYRVRV